MISEFRVPDEALLRLFEAARKVGVVVNVHAENGDTTHSPSTPSTSAT